ncbi:hypothetical protein [Streptomyces sp. CC77]|uniref:hypothetical protein n=1 Tax=Streptomyces sp. CC77 TaxID=1906739 RepID=UPI000D1A8194|nr:hypothetical protein [Streptomyces sp. CC77]
MLPPDASAEGLADRLTALGLAPRLRDHQNHVCVEVEVTEALSPDSWRELLAVLEVADRFGLTARSAAPQVLWAAVRKGSPRRLEPPEDQAIS